MPFRVFRQAKVRCDPCRPKLRPFRSGPVPQTKRQIQSFEGLAGYYHRFVLCYSEISAPLPDLAKKHCPKKIKWTDEDQKAFEPLKATLVTRPILQAPDFENSFVLNTDASDTGIGSVLMQQGPDEQVHPVLYLSKELSQHEENWSTIEK